MVSVTTDPETLVDTDALRASVARSCRILAHQGVVENILGHVSARTGPNRMLIRCRGPQERGLRVTEPTDIRLVSFDGQVLDDPTGQYRAPHELPIHAAVYRDRPAAMAVVHAHPRTVLVATLAGITLRPVFGAYNIPAMRMALAGIPVWPRSVLVNRDDLAEELLQVMGDRDLCIMHGHGVTVAGASVAQATVRTLDLNVLAGVHLQLAQLNADPPTLAAHDIALLPDLGGQFNDTTLFRYYADAEAASGRPI